MNLQSHLTIPALPISSLIPISDLVLHLSSPQTNPRSTSYIPPLPFLPIKSLLYHQDTPL